MNNIMEITLYNCIYLILAHTVGDYLFQSGYVYNNKKESDYILYVHAILYGFGILVVTYIFSYDISLFQFIFIVVWHVPIDYFKLSGLSIKIFKTEKISLLMDQIMKYIILIISLFIFK